LRALRGAGAAAGVVTEAVAGAALPVAPAGATGVAAAVLGAAAVIREQGAERGKGAAGDGGEQASPGGDGSE